MDSMEAGPAAVLTTPVVLRSAWNKASPLRLINFYQIAALVFFLSWLVAACLCSSVSLRVFCSILCITVSFSRSSRRED